MSYPSYPQSPGYPPGAGQPPAKLRGRRPIRVGVMLLIVGVVALVVGGVIVAQKSLNKVDGFQRITIAAGTGTVNFTKAGGYLAYYEAAHIDTHAIPAVGVAILGPSGTPTVLDTPYGNRSDGKVKILSYDHDGHNGIALYQFHISDPGTYQVRLEATPQTASDGRIAFGKSIAGGTVLGGLIVVLGVLLLVAGLVVLIVGLVQRRRHKKLIAAGGYGGYGGYPGQPYPAAPYPAAPYPGQPYPGQPYPGQPYPGQPYPGQPYPGQPYPGQPHPAAPYPGQAYQSEPVTSAPPPSEPWPPVVAEPSPGPATPPAPPEQPNSDWQPEQPPRWAPRSDPTAPPPSTPSDPLP